MNLLKIFESIEFPENGKENSFRAIIIPEHPKFRIAINYYGYPVILLAIPTEDTSARIKNYRLKNLKVEHGVSCKIEENGKSIVQDLTVITFTSSNRSLQEYFLKIVEIFIKLIENCPTPQKIEQTLNNFVEVFRSIDNPPISSVIGLWAELFLMDNSKIPRTLVKYWHNIPEEKFDFNSTHEKIEVKSSSNFERTHHFSSEQLNPPVGTNLIVASMFVRKTRNGRNIQDLLDSITSKLDGDLELTEKLYRVTFQTIGNSLESYLLEKFDQTDAKSSLQYYLHDDIKKIKSQNIPNEVSQVRFISDLSKINPINPLSMKEKGDLFSAL